MILLTGGLGFLGCNLAYYLAKQGEKIVLTKHRTSRIPSFIEPFIDKSITISTCDIQDFSNLFSILEKHPIESVIHAASGYGQERNLYQTLNVNVRGTMNILEASRIKNIRRFTFTSSQSVYQRSKDKWHVEDEDLPLASSHTISLTKKASELICDYYRKEYGMDVLITRPSQIYGPLYVSGRNPLEKMVENSALGKQANLPEVNPEEGNTLIYVKDCARAIGLIHLAVKTRFSIYNIGDRYVGYGEMAETVRKILPEAQIELGKSGEGKTPEPMQLNMERMAKEFGFRPEYDLEKGIKDYIRWLREGKY